MKNPKKYLLSGIVGFSLMAGSLGYVYSLDALKAPKESAAIIENYPVSDEQSKVSPGPVSAGQTSKTGAVVYEAGSNKSSIKTEAVNKQQSTSNLQESTPVAMPTQPASVQQIEPPSTVASQTTGVQNNTENTTTDTVIPSAVTSQPAQPQRTPVKTPVKTTTTKKTSTTKAS